MKRRGRPIAPYQQGDLDELCGVYAIINAVRLTVGRHRRFKATDYDKLFAALVAETDRVQGFGRANLEGIGTPYISRLLSVANDYTFNRLSQELLIRRPLLGRKRPSISQMIAIVENELKSNDVALLIGIGGFTSTGPLLELSPRSTFAYTIAVV